MLSTDSHRSTKSVDRHHSFVVDFDAEKGKRPRKDEHGNPKPDQHRVAIKFAKKIDLGMVREYLEGHSDFHNGIVEGISKFITTPHEAPLTFSDFLDHLLRESPSKLLINLRRSYFSRHTISEERTLLPGGIEAMKGVYQSIRLAEVLRLSLLLSSC